jgi:cytochrome b561
MADGVTQAYRSPTGGPAARTEYSVALRILHWLTALAVFILVPVAVAMHNMPDGAFKNALYEVHKSVGIIAFVLVVLRIVARLSGGAPPPDASLTPFQRTASAIVHGLIYVLLLAMPILGYAGTNMCCKPVNLFWVWPVPINLTGSEATVKTIFAAHYYLGWTLVALVVIHISAAVYHHRVLKDGVLRRMLPQR